MPITIRTGTAQGIPSNPSEWRGWISTEVSYGLNNIAAAFTVEMTNVGRCEEFPNGSGFPLHPFTPVRIYADDTLVLTGHVDTDGIQETPTEHIVEVTGRSRGGDLVDCDHVRDNDDGWLWQGQTALQIMQDVAAPFGIAVDGTLDLEPIDEYRATIGDKAFEIMDVLARREGAVLQAMPDGSILLTRASSERVGFTIHCPRDTETMHDASRRFSEYHARGQRHGYDDVDPNAPADVRAFVSDDLVPRYRPRIVQPEGSVDSGEALTRIQWQRARDRGDGLRMELSVPCFTDPNGNLWRTNTRVWVERPSHNVNQELLIAGVTFRSDSDEGDTTRLLLKPVEAYLPEPRRRRRLTQKARSASVAATPVAAANASDYTGFEL